MFHPIRSLQVAAWASRLALRQIIRPRIWLPFLVIALTQTIVLLTLANAFDPRVISLSLPYVRWVGGEPATHYPFYFYYFPTLYARADYAVTILVSSITTGAATVLFSSAYGQSQGVAWRQAFRRFLPLLLVSLVVTVLVVSIFSLTAPLFRKALTSGRTLRWGVRGLEVGLIVLAQGLFAYSTAWIMLEGKSAAGAVKNSVVFFFHRCLPTLLIIGIPFLIMFPLRYLVERTDLFITRFKPESLVWIMQLGILMELILSFLIVGSTTALFLSRPDEAQGRVRE